MIWYSISTNKSLCLFVGFSLWRLPFFWYSYTVAPLAVLSPKKIMCFSWRWVAVAPNPKDFGLFPAQVVQTMQPKMAMNSLWQEVEVSWMQHPLCLLDEGNYSLCSMLHSVVKKYILTVKPIFVSSGEMYFLN